MNKIFCFGDGYASGHIWPEWPTIIASLYPDIEHKNFGVVGAGNEFITSAIIQAYREDPTAFFLVQWADHSRFDKLLEDDSWDDIIKTDPVYHFNTVKLNNQKWWISSASQQIDVRKYHQHYIQQEQSKLRTFNYMYLASKLLEKQSLFFSTENMSAYSNLSRFSDIRQQEVQPSPWVHMCYVEEKILPSLPIQPNISRLSELKSRIKQHNWVAYDPNREQIWKDIINF